MMNKYDNFYVFLPSDPYTNYFENNTCTHYTTKLLKPISLQGDWEVALCDIVFPRSWYNLSEPSKIQIGRFGKNLECHELSATQTLPAGNYATPQILSNKINSKLSELDQDAPKLKYNELTNIVEIRTVQESEVIKAPVFSRYLAEMLGFDNILSCNVRRNRAFIATREVDIEAGRSSLYVYTDIVDPVLVGDTCAPLLRIVQVPKTLIYGAHEFLTFTNPYYIPLVRNYFETIQIDIRDVTGQRIPFRTGRVNVTLHFRKHGTNSY